MSAVYTINAVVNLFAAALVLYTSIKVYRCGMLPKYLFVLFWIIGIGWIALYIFVVFGHQIDIDSVVIGRVFIRPLITLTLGAIAATFIHRARQC